MAKGQDTPQGGDGFIKYLADDRTWLPAHRLLLETFPVLTASAPARLRQPLPGTIPLAPALPCACRNREWHRSSAWPPGHPGCAGTAGARGARNGRSGQGHAVPVRVTPRGSHPAPCQWQSGCPSPGINPGLCPWENALRCIFLRVGFTPGNCKWQSRPGGCSWCEPHGSAPACAQPRGQLKRGLITV